MATNEIENMLFFISNTKLIIDTQAYIDELSLTFKKIKIYLAGSHKIIENLQLQKGTKWLKNINDFEALIGQ